MQEYFFSKSKKNELGCNLFKLRSSQNKFNFFVVVCNFSIGEVIYTSEVKIQNCHFLAFDEFAKKHIHEKGR